MRALWQFWIAKNLPENYPKHLPAHLRGAGAGVGEPAAAERRAWETVGAGIHLVGAHYFLYMGSPHSKKPSK